MSEIEKAKKLLKEIQETDSNLKVGEFRFLISGFIVKELEGLKVYHETLNWRKLSFRKSETLDLINHFIEN